MSDVKDISDLALATLSANQKPFLLEAPEGRVFVARPTFGGPGNSQVVWAVDQITSPNAAEVLMPKTVAQAVRLQTTGSMIDYINRFRNSNTALFADISSDTIVSIIDYHTESGSDEDGVKARLGAHRATLKLPFSQEWLTWQGISGRLMSHKEFASFLEENSIDVVTPNGADLLELCRDLQVINNVNFTSAVRDGDYTSVSFQKESDASAKGNISLPPSITLNIPVYFGEAPVLITAFMRKKIGDDGLSLGVKLSRAENVRQDEFHRIVGEVAVGVNHLTTVYGTPA